MNAHLFLGRNFFANLDAKTKARRSPSEGTPTPLDSLLLQGSAELDKRVIEAMGGCAHRDIKGWYREGPDGDRTLCCGQCHESPTVPDVSRSIAAAWKVVEWWAKRGAKVNVMNRYAPSWGCNIITEPNAAPAHAVPYVAVPQFFVGSCASASVAICRATLDALGVPHHDI